MENMFKKLFDTNVSQHVEKKGAFSYLSWPYAVATLRQADPTARWDVKRFDGLPYLHTPAGCFVEVEVTVQGITLGQIHPVLNASNKPILEPTAFDINTSIQRCLVKAIALHGLGLSVYTGEDLPPSTSNEAPRTQPKVAEMPFRKASTAQVRYIQRLLDETGTDPQRVLASHNVASFEELSSKQASEVIKSLDRQRSTAA